MTPSDAARFAGDGDSAMGYSPTSPSSSVRMHQWSRRKYDDVEAAAHMCKADEILQLSILETNTEILRLSRSWVQTRAGTNVNDEQP